MNPMLIISLLPTLLRIGQQLAKGGVSFNSILALIQGEDVKDVLTQVGGLHFPGVAPDRQAEAGVTVFAPEYTKRVQNAMNTLLTPPPSPPLDVDGVYGFKTRTAVTAYQKAKGLEIQDGWAGDKTMAQIAKDEAAKIAVPLPVPALPKT